MTFPFSRRSWDLSEEFSRNTSNCNPGTFSSLPQTPNQVARPAPSPHHPHGHALWPGPFIWGLCSRESPESLGNWQAQGWGSGRKSCFLSLPSVPVCLYSSRCPPASIQVPRRREKVDNVWTEESWNQFLQELETGQKVRGSLVFWEWMHPLTSVYWKASLHPLTLPTRSPRNRWWMTLLRSPPSPLR